MNDMSGKGRVQRYGLVPKRYGPGCFKESRHEACVEKWGADPEKKCPLTFAPPSAINAEKEKEGVLPAGHEKSAIFMNFKSKNVPCL